MSLDPVQWKETRAGRGNSLPRDSRACLAISMRTYLCFLLLFWVGQPYSTFSSPLSKRTSGFPAKRRALELPANSRHELSRSKRSWMWNQFFLLEEYTGSDYQYVGKVGFLWVLWQSKLKSLKKLLLRNREGVNYSPIQYELLLIW